MKLKQHFITTRRPYREGAVEVFEQKIPELDLTLSLIHI